MPTNDARAPRARAPARPHAARAGSARWLIDSLWFEVQLNVMQSVKGLLHVRAVAHRAKPHENIEKAR